MTDRRQSRPPIWHPSQESTDSLQHTADWFTIHAPRVTGELREACLRIAHDAISELIARTDGVASDADLRGRVELRDRTINKGSESR